MLGAGAVILAVASVLPWGWEDLPLPILHHRFDERMDLPWLAMLWTAALYALIAAALARRVTARTLLILVTPVVALAVAATVGAAHDVAWLFSGADSTNWSRYAPPGTPGPSHAFSAGLFVAVAGVAVLLAAMALTVWQARGAGWSSRPR